MKTLSALCIKVEKRPDGSLLAYLRYPNGCMMAVSSDWLKEDIRRNKVDLINGELRKDNSLHLWDLPITLKNWIKVFEKECSKLYPDVTQAISVYLQSNSEVFIQVCFADLSPQDFICVLGNIINTTMNINAFTTEGIVARVLSEYKG